MMNVINGGRHAQNSLDFQEFMIVPHGAPSFAEALRYGAESFHALHDLLHKAGYSTAVGHEGGFAPNLKTIEEACELIVAAIRKAGLRAGDDVAIALDPAASSFATDNQYVFAKSGNTIVSRDELLTLYNRLIEIYPIVSIEDGFAEDDWEGFRLQTAACGDRIQIVGDDLYVTNPRFIQRGIESRTTNAVLIKLNQIGTVTETITAVQTCRDAGWAYVISHRSGETEDTFIADFAVAIGGGQIKAGSLRERLAKYNRLLEIERELGSAAVYESPFLGMELDVMAIAQTEAHASSLQTSGATASVKSRGYPGDRRGSLCNNCPCPRIGCHAEFIAAARKAGAAVSLITDGDDSRVIHTADPDSTGIDLYMGIDDSPQGVAAAALRCIGGQKASPTRRQARAYAAVMSIVDCRKKVDQIGWRSRPTQGSRS